MFLILDYTSYNIIPDEIRIYFPIDSYSFLFFTIIMFIIIIISNRKSVGIIYLFIPLLFMVLAWASNGILLIKLLLNLESITILFIEVQAIGKLLLFIFGVRLLRKSSLKEKIVGHMIMQVIITILFKLPYYLDIIYMGMLVDFIFRMILIEVIGVVFIATYVYITHRTFLGLSDKVVKIDNQSRLSIDL
jgi:hypothetical protein